MKFFVGLVLGCCLVSEVQADVVAQWTFETSPPADVTSASIGSIAADTGSGTASGSHVSAATVWSTPAGNGSANSLSANNWAIGDYFQFDVSTVGFSGLTVTWDQTSSTTGPGVFNFEYRVGNSGAFTNALSNYTVLPNSATAPGLGAWNNTTAFAGYGFNVNLSSNPALNGQALVQFRLTVATDADAVPPGTIATTGTSRVDNFSVITAVPEPSSIALVSLTGFAVMMIANRRRKSKSKLS